MPWNCVERRRLQLRCWPPYLHQQHQLFTCNCRRHIGEQAAHAGNCAIDGEHQQQREAESFAKTRVCADRNRARDDQAEYQPSDEAAKCNEENEVAGAALKLGDAIPRHRQTCHKAADDAAHDGGNYRDEDGARPCQVIHAQAYVPV